MKTDNTLQEREALLRSRPDYENCPVKQLAFELAFELEEADLSINDLVSINRKKLEAIAARVLERQASRTPAPSVTVEELVALLHPVIRGDFAVGGEQEAKLAAQAILTQFNVSKKE